MTYLEKGDKGTSIEGQEALVAIAKGALGQVRPGCRLAKWQRKARTIVHLSEFDVPDDPPQCTEWLWRKECEEVTRFVGSSRAEDAIAALGRQRSQLIADRCCGLLDAATFGKWPNKVVENLIERGASVNIRKMGRTPLKVVADQGRAKLLPYLVRKLRSEVADSGPLESEALIEGIRHPAVVEALLKEGTRLGPDPIGRLPLHEALHQPWRKILGEKKGAPHPAYQQLVAASDPLARDGDGNTIFHRWSPSENDFLPDSFLSRLIRDQRERFLETLVAENCEGELANFPDRDFLLPGMTIDMHRMIRGCFDDPPPPTPDPLTPEFTLKLCDSPGCRLTWWLIDAGITPDELSRIRRLFRREPEGGDSPFESVPPEYLKPQLAEIFAGTVSVNY